MAKDPSGPISYEQYVKSDRVFVRPIQGEYNLTEELKRLRAMPRVRKGRDLHFDAGPQAYTKHYIEPKDGIGQTLHIHLEEYAPGAKSQKHGHVNEAVFYILDGEGAEVHDGIRYEWKAGDAAIVHNNCVHQHFNRQADKPARALVMKTKPMYLFMNMLFQKIVDPRSKEPTWPGFEPREEPSYADHDHEHDVAHAHDHQHDHSHGD
jgi:quercetin dioxygenase-like cupin family protein